MGRSRMNTSNLWQAGSFTRLPNDVTEWILHKSETVSEIKIVLFIARLSCGFDRWKTNGRLCLGDFAAELGCNVSTASRTIAKLLKAGRVYRFDPQGPYHYYSLYSDAKAHEASAKRHAPDTKDRATDAREARSPFAPMQSVRGGAESISSIMKRMQANR